MGSIERRILSLTVALAAVALLATASGLAARSAGEPEQQTTPAQHQPAASAPSATPRLTGTVVRWINDRIDLKTPDGKVWKVAINADTDRQAEIKEGAQVTVEYRREISGFVIADRVLPAGGAKGAAGKESEHGRAAGA
jgi:uncharacterized protein YfaQ (DUF2300 family)